tara:strand:- start:20720 stop:22018 length:1299 start_codon:yes stop_codon:yes gene_type:complete
MNTTRSIEIDLRPDANEWKAALQNHTPHAARAQLGIPNDRPIVMSGHQPIAFHNGILAKLIAQHEIAQSTGAGRVWIVPDQDIVDLETIRVPIGSGTDLRTRTVQILEPGSIPPGVPAASLPAMDPIDPDDDRLADLVEYLRGYAYESSLARQFASATIQLACDRLGIDPPQIIYASDLFTSEAVWDQVGSAMRLDPDDAVRSYNDAAAKHPEAKIRPLDINNDDYERPVWKLRDGYARIPVNDASFDQFNTAPRALLMSGICRAFLSELFIHGSGGWTYDQITEHWFQNWLNITLNPMARASASVYLPLGIDDPNAIDLKEAHWRFHHARHHPALVGDDDTQRTRDELVSQINTARAAGDNPDPIYQQLVRVLEDHRVRNANGLSSLESQIEHARTHAKQIELANDRTWAFPLFDDESLHMLKDRIHNAMN